MTFQDCRALYLAVAAAATALVTPMITHAQTYPAKPLRLFVGYAPGGGQDQVARLLGQGLAERIGQQVMFSSLAGAVPYIRQAKLRALGVTTARRSPTLPDVPAIGEQVEGYDASGLIGVGAPRGVPSDIAELLNRHLSAVAAQPNAQARFTDLGSAVADLSPAAFGQYMGREIERWRGVIVAAGIKPE